MGRVAEFLSWALSTNETTDPPEVKGDPGGGALFTAEHFSPPGIDSQPTNGDFFATHDGPGTGDEIVSGYHDPLIANQQAGAGETRTYARNAAGTTACEVFCKADGTIKITSIAPGSKLNLNGVEIDQDGNISAKSLTATGEVSVGEITLTGHAHPTAALGAPSLPVPFVPEP